MAIIKRVALPKDDHGNDPNDFRNDPAFIGKLEPSKPKPQMNWVDSFVLTDEEAEMIVDPKWIMPNLVIQGHVIAIPAPPNGGKTTIFMWLAGEMADTHQVYYVNADTSGGDAKKMVADSKAKGYTMLLPDMKAGMSMDDVVRQLEAMNEAESDYSEIVFIFDTLKKMTDVINKSKAKQLLKTLRGLSAKGMTIILLAHTNKYNDSDGQPIYEGTGDLRADVDELIYLVPNKNKDGSMTVSTKPDKVRGSFQPITFNISPNREVTLSDDYVDVLTLNKTKRQREKDKVNIEAIIEAIKCGKHQQTELIKYCKDSYHIGRRSVENVLNRYRKPPLKLWDRQDALQHNAKRYHLTDEKCSPLSSGESENR